MLFRKIESTIREYLQSNSNKIMLIDGARQIGKTYIIRHVGSDLFTNYIEINLAEDFKRERLFANITSVNDFYFKLSTKYGDKMDMKENTLIFLDEIQTYPELITMLKFLRQDDKFTYIASGSLLGVTLSFTSSIPMGSIQVVRMYPLDFEEFLKANGFNDYAINTLRQFFLDNQSLDEAMHDKMLDLFKKYLIVGGLPDAVNSYIETKNIAKIRSIQDEIHTYYAADASKYDTEKKLVIRKIYDMIPSNLENKKKRIIFKDIENNRRGLYEHYQDEFEYLTSAGIALGVTAITEPKFPVIQSSKKNLLKLYMNDVGILTSILYKNNPAAILTDQKSINLGTVYENVVAMELKAHGFDLFYYDVRSKGEVDFVVDDYDALSALPIEVKSGKDYTIHRAINTFLSNKDYNVKKGIVLSNAREVKYGENGTLYLPIYYIMFFKPNQVENMLLD
ncbi:MAG: ATP-binding protein [Clostridia bacterium]|nr:ATP-binding protein [Clostridia bacterium]